MRCWGGYDAMIGHGQLGNGSPEGVGDDPGEMPPPDLELGGPAAQIAAGMWHTCALMMDASVRCWGKGDAGALGTGSPESLGDAPGEMPPPAVALGGPAVQVAAGGAWGGHSCALMEGGDVLCWGENGYGQLGFDSGGQAIGDGPDEMPPPAVALPLPAVFVATSEDGSCAILESGAVYCWGGFGGGPTPQSIPIGGVAVELGVGGTSHCALLESGAVRCWGDNHWGNLGYGHDQAVSPADADDIALGGPAQRVVLNQTHSCALTSGKLRCWGDNTNSQLGYGPTGNIGDDPDEMPPPIHDFLDDVIDVSVGGAHTCARTAADEYYCWGWNGVGELGLGHKMTIGDEPGEVPSDPVPVF